MYRLIELIKHLNLKKKVPIRLQMNQYDCGSSCLAMILAYYGYEANLSKLKERFASLGNGRDGSSMLKIKEVAQTYNLNCFGKKANYNDLNNDFLPAILFWENKHYVILERIQNNNKYVIVDPSMGRQILCENEFAEKYSKIFLAIYPNEKFEPFIEMKYSKVKYFKHLILNNKKYFILAILLALVLQVVSIAVPVLMQISVDKTLHDEKYSVFSIIIMGMALITILQLLFCYFKDLCIIKLQEILDMQLTNNFVSHMLLLPYKYFEVRSRGDLMLRINSNATIREMLSQKFISTIINIFLVIVTFIYIYIKSKLVAGSLLFMGILQLLVFFLSRNKFKKLTQNQIAAQSFAGSFMTEVLEGISTIKSLCIEDSIDKKWKELFNNQLKAVQNKSYYQTKVNTINNAFNFLTPLLILLLGIYQIIKGNITIGMLFSFQLLASSFLGPLNSLSLMLNDLVMVDTLLDRIYDVMDTEEDTKNGGSRKDAHVKSIDLNGSIRIENVSFKYTDYSEYVLKDVNLRVRAGQRIALVGKSGSGKSTLSNLLVGLHTPTKGKIYFDEYEINEIDKRCIRQKIGVVLQDNFVFNRTIYENITIHSPDSSMEDVLAATQLADIHSDIEKMPMKYNTLISEAGTNLSGGQKQRIALARSLVNKPNILLLDEATSALDAVTESVIEKNLRRLNCTQIIIAHRLSTIINSDTIYILDEGKIIDSGTHFELMKRCSKYKNLLISQIPNSQTQKSILQTKEGVG